jgi:hypothetical protein
MAKLQDQVSSHRESNTDRNTIDLEIKQMEEAISMNDTIIPSPDLTNNYQQNENGMIHHSLEV